MLFQISEGLIEIGVQLLLAGPAHHTGSGAVTAIGGATVGDKKEHPVGIAMHESRHRHVTILTAWVGHFSNGNRSLSHMGNHLTTDWTAGMIPLDQIEVVGGDCQRELVTGEDDSGSLLGGQHEVLLQSLKGRHPVLELPFPVIPQLRRHITPISGSR